MSPCWRQRAARFAHCAARSARSGDLAAIADAGRIQSVTLLESLTEAAGRAIAGTRGHGLERPARAVEQAHRVRQSRVGDQFAQQRLFGGQMAAQGGATDAQAVFDIARAPPRCGCAAISARTCSAMPGAGGSSRPPWPRRQTLTTNAANARRASVYRPCCSASRHCRSANSKSIAGNRAMSAPASGSGSVHKARAAPAPLRREGPPRSCRARSVGRAY